LVVENVGVELEVREKTGGWGGMFGWVEIDKREQGRGRRGERGGRGLKAEKGSREEAVRRGE